MRTTWKIVYYLAGNWNGVSKGVALVEAADRNGAFQAFREQYNGQYSTIDSVERL